MSVSHLPQRALLLRVARQAMMERGLEPDFPPAVQDEVRGLAGPASPAGADVRDLRALPWCSIDNDDSRDLDQLTVAEALDGGRVRVLVAVADVNAIVAAGSPLDDHAHTNTTSVYTPPQVFPMLPERLSTDLTSLNADQDRLALVVEITVDGDGEGGASSIYRAAVRNRAKLAYPSVGAWLEGRGPMPPGIGAVAGLEATLRLQDQVAQRLRAFRHEHGALELQTLEVKARFDGDTVSGLEAEARNRAMDIIEDFMIASNGAIARFLAQRGFPVMRRVLPVPVRWPRIVDLALESGVKLPPQADARALHDFLVARRAADPLRFPDLSLAVVKLLGRGEYAASYPGEEVPGHFGLAVSDYTHSTAPNRRYPDLITQRLVRAALAGRPVPYARDQLAALATHCTLKEDAAQKVERLMRKAAAACLLGDRIGERFDGIVTGASEKGTYARIFDPPAEGRIEQGQKGLDVGDRVHLKLVHTDPEKGFIDFARVG
ncbi:MAG TPA: RNB domain-containing ribonuclease [Candidatus Eisenbacteria bacterium]